MKIYIGPAVGRNYEPSFLKCLLRLLGDPATIWAPEEGDALVSRSRSLAASRFLARKDADVFLSIDTDIQFAPSQAKRLCAEALERNVVMVGVYSCRSKELVKPSSVLPRGVTLDSRSGRPVPVQWGASGFMAVPRKVMEGTLEHSGLPLCHPNERYPFYPLFMPFVVPNDDGDPIYLSEDYAFCERVRQAGFEIEALPNVRLAHVGPFPYELYEGDYTLTRLDEPGYRYSLVCGDALETVSA